MSDDYNTEALKKHLERQYLATIARLRALKLPSVPEEFLLEVASMPIEELQRRVMIQRDWVGAFNKCLDGLKLATGSDRHREPDEIRRIVLGLLKTSQK